MGLKRRTQNYFSEDLDILVLLVGEAVEARDKKIDGWVNWRLPDNPDVKNGRIRRNQALKAYTKLYKLLP